MQRKIKNLMMQLRMEIKAEENAWKPPLDAADVVQTGDFIFSQKLTHEGDSGKLLLAKRKTDRAEQYLVKHEFTDCACNEYVYTKLAQDMGYCMPDAVLFQISEDEKRPYFQTEYIIGERYLNVVTAQPSWEEVRAQAKNWPDYFSFYGLYGMTGEGDGVEVLLAEDKKIYRVDTTNAFPISNYHLDLAGLTREYHGINPGEEIKRQLLSRDLTDILNFSSCDWLLSRCLEIDSSCKPYFLEPFARIQEIRADYIEGFLNTLCYFYPDFIGDYFKRYISELQRQCGIYLKENRE